MPRRHANTHDPAESFEKYKRAIEKAEISLSAVNRELKTRNRKDAINQALNVAYWIGQAECELSYIEANASNAVERKIYGQRLTNLNHTSTELAKRIGAIR